MGRWKKKQGKGMVRWRGAPWQLSCEEANGLSSPSHAHRMFSDGHSSGETHIGVATGTELQKALMQLYWDDSAAVCTLVILYVTKELAEHESVTIF